MRWWLFAFGTARQSTPGWSTDRLCQNVALHGSPAAPADQRLALKALGAPAGDDDSVPSGVNSEGFVAGTSDSFKGFLWVKGHMWQLPNAYGADSINDRCQILVSGGIAILSPASSNGVPACPKDL